MTDRLRATLHMTLEMYAKAYKEQWAYKDLAYYEMAHGICRHLRQRFGKDVEEEFLEVSGFSFLHFAFPAPIIMQNWEAGVDLPELHRSCIKPRIDYLAGLLNVDLSHDPRPVTTADQ